MAGDPVLSARFEEEMYRLYEEPKKHGYNATYSSGCFASTAVSRPRSVLLASPQANPGLSRLFELDLLDLSVEQLVLTPPFTELFEAHERKTARDRLDALKTGS